MKTLRDKAEIEAFYDGFIKGMNTHERKTWVHQMDVKQQCILFADLAIRDAFAESLQGEQPKQELTDFIEALKKEWSSMGQAVSYSSIISRLEKLNHAPQKPILTDEIIEKESFKYGAAGSWGIIPSGHPNCDDALYTAHRAGMQKARDYTSEGSEAVDVDALIDYMRMCIQKEDTAWLDLHSNNDIKVGFRRSQDHLNK